MDALRRTQEIRDGSAESPPTAPVRPRWRCSRRWAVAAWPGQAHLQLSRPARTATGSGDSGRGASGRLPRRRFGPRVLARRARRGASDRVGPGCGQPRRAPLACAGKQSIVVTASDVPRDALSEGVLPWRRRWPHGRHVRRVQRRGRCRRGVSCGDSGRDDVNWFRPDAADASSRADRSGCRRRAHRPLAAAPSGLGRELRSEAARGKTNGGGVRPALILPPRPGSRPRRGSTRCRPVRRRSRP